MKAPNSRRKPGRGDANQTAFRVVQEATAEHEEDESPAPATASTPEKNPAAVALGRLGGRKGGKARAEKLSPEERSAIAKKAAGARWSKPVQGT